MLAQRGTLKSGRHAGVNQELMCCETTERDVTLQGEI